MTLSTCNRAALNFCVLTATWGLLYAHQTLGDVWLQSKGKEQPGIGAITIAAILDEACQIAVAQNLQDSIQLDRVYLQIADLQIKAQDFESASHTIKHCGYSYGANSANVKLAEALARAGHRERAFEVLQELGTDHGWNQNLLADRVQMFWVEHLIATNKFESAQQAISKLVAPRSRPEALSKLALAHAKRGDKTISNRLLMDACQAAARIPDEYDQAIAIDKVAKAANEFVDFKTASSMTQQLTKLAEAANSGLRKVGHLRKAAPLAAKVNDQKTAQTLFKKALESRHAIQPPDPCPEANRIIALSQIAKAQASVGFIEQALATAATISNDDSWRGTAERDEVLREIGIAQAKAGDEASGIATALSIENYFQYQNDALAEIARVYVQKGDKKSALATALKIENPSRKAAAILGIATQYAKDGDKRAAKDIAGEIQLKASLEPLFSDGVGEVAFDFSNAKTWGILFDSRRFYTSASHSMTINRASSLAAAAMALHQALAEPNNLDYAVAFQDVEKSVVQSLACAHAKNGDAKDAYAWAIRIGSSEKIESEDDYDAKARVDQRLHALIGVAEGMLAKQAQANKK